VPAGSHRVVFTYQDRALQTGLVVSFVTVAGLVGLWRWRRRQAHAAERAQP
jgi:MYXO-CTERM domain-containing protein